MSKFLDRLISFVFEDDEECPYFDREINTKKEGSFSKPIPRQSFNIQNKKPAPVPVSVQSSVPSVPPVKPKTEFDIPAFSNKTAPESLNSQAQKAKDDALTARLMKSRQENEEINKRLMEEPYVPKEIMSPMFGNLKENQREEAGDKRGKKRKSVVSLTGEFTGGAISPIFGLDLSSANIYKEKMTSEEVEL